MSVGVVFGVGGFSPLQIGTLSRRVWMTGLRVPLSQRCLRDCIGFISWRVWKRTYCFLVPCRPMGVSNLSLVVGGGLWIFPHCGVTDYLHWWDVLLVKRIEWHTTSKTVVRVLHSHSSMCQVLSERLRYFSGI